MAEHTPEQIQAAVESEFARRWLHPAAREIPGGQIGMFVHTPSGAILSVGMNCTCISRDGGKTFSQPRSVCREDEGAGRMTTRGMLTVLPDGRLMMAYLDEANCRLDEWDRGEGHFPPTNRLAVWTIFSDDEGESWSDRREIFGGMCGALTDILATRQGTVVLPVTAAKTRRGRFVQEMFVSDDCGESFSSTIIDLGGHGHHDGAMEPTLVELDDGRLWMLIRTSLERFWEAFSDDGGFSWRVLRPSTVRASSAQGKLLKLASGRIALVWNPAEPLRNEERGHDFTPRLGACFSELPGSWHRGQLVGAVTEDQGRTWSEPVVLARQPEGHLSYPQLFEPSPGVLWVSTRWNRRFGGPISPLSLPPMAMEIDESVLLG